MKRKNIVFIIILLATIILGVVAVVTALKLREIGKEPVAPTAPESKPKAAEEPSEPEPPAEPTEVVNPKCVQEFIVREEPGELVCDRIEMIPNRESVEAEDERELEAIVSGGTPPYSYSWTVGTSADDAGSFSDETTNPTTWTAPADLTEDSGWTFNVMVVDGEDSKSVCSTTVSFSLEPSPEPSPSPSPGTSPSPSPGAKTSPSPKAKATPAPELPEAGIISPTIFASVVGILLVVLGILL